MNFKILVVTDRFEFWLDYFSERIEEEYIIRKQEIKTRNGFFQVKFCHDYSDCMRGYNPDKIIIDKNLSNEDFRSISALLSHRKRIYFSRNHYRKWELE